MPAAPAASLLDVVIPPPSDFDLAGCPFDPSSANTFQLMMSDRQRFGSTITPDFRMPSLPPQTSSFSEWFDLKVLIPIEPAPPTLVVTPDQVDLDYRLLNILDSVVEGDEAVTLFTLLDLPPAAEDFTDVEEYYRLIEHPISLTMIRDRILRQVYKQVHAVLILPLLQPSWMWCAFSLLQTSDLLKDLELLSSNVSLLDLEPTSAVGTDITLLKKRLREVDAKLKSPVSRRRSAPVDPKSSPVPSPTPSPPTKSREHLCKACGVTSLPSVIGKGEQCCAACLVDPSKMLNRRLWVLWPSESKWFPGRIDAFHPASKQFRIL